jgi:hypothetical protein
MRVRFVKQHRIEVDNQTSIIYPEGLITSDLSDEIAEEAIAQGAAVNLDAAAKATTAEPEPVEKKPATKSKK